MREDTHNRHALHLILIPRIFLPAIVLGVLLSIIFPGLLRTKTSPLEIFLFVLLTAFMIFWVMRPPVERLYRMTKNLREANLILLELLGSAVAERDSDSVAHSYRVTIMAARLAKKTGLDDGKMRGLLAGALLHDIGKIDISEHILNKPGRLNEQERTLMQTHATKGSATIAGIPWLKDANDVVCFHHEKFDGSGYPSNRRGADIPLTARIFSIIDVFDALTSPRPYKKAFSLDEALTIMEEGRNKDFDPSLLDSFIHIAPSLYGSCTRADIALLREELRSILVSSFPDTENLLLQGK